jgi:outer membrane receptor protein involved in Fe transport
VSSASGTAGTSRRINIRGASSINLSNQPLIFVDGVRMVEGQPGLGAGGQSADRLNNMNPEDIESIELVKGPAAATLYGADASAGVIQIITRKGRAGSPRFTQSVSTEIGTVVQQWTPPANFGACTATLVAATSTNPLCRGQAIGTLVSDNPLVREGAFRDGRVGNIGYSANGGGAGFGYYFSANSDLQTGTLPNNEFGRKSLRTNFNFVPSPRVTVSASLAVSQSRLKAPDNDNNIFGFLGGGMLGSPLTRTDNGSGANGWFGVNRNVSAISAIDNQFVTRGTTSGVTITHMPRPWLTQKLIVGGDIANDEQTRFFPKSPRNSYTGLLNTGQNVQTRTGSQRYTIDYLANAKRDFGRDDAWELNASAGMQLIQTRSEFVSITATGFVTNSNNVPSAASQTTGGGTLTDVRQRGWVSQVQLGHLNRRFVQLGLRVDEFSVFGSDVAPAKLPKVSGSWVISEEAFFAPLARTVGSLRLRAAWGQTGRAPGAGAALQTLAAAPSLVGSSPEPGAVLGNIGNDSLRPERGSEVELGFDASFLKERVSLEVTYFDKTTDDLILNRPLPPSQGYAFSPAVNIGQVKNSGLEVSVTATPVQRNAVTWDLRLGMATLKNELTDLGEVTAFGALNRFTEGAQLGAFVSHRIRNINEATGVVTVADTAEVMGNIFPAFEGTLSSTVTLFGQVRVSAQFDTKRDFLVFNNTAFFRETQVVRAAERLDPTLLSPRERLRRYGNPAAGQPAFVRENGTSATVNEVRDAYLQPGDFVRFRELGVAWEIPSRYLTRMGPVQGATLSFAVQNLRLWKNAAFTGRDPEVISTAGGQFTRDDFLTQPNPRTSVMRLNLSF